MALIWAVLHLGAIFFAAAAAHIASNAWRVPSSGDLGRALSVLATAFMLYLMAEAVKVFK